MNKSMKWMITAIIITVLTMAMLVVGNVKIKENFDATVEDTCKYIEDDMEVQDVDGHVSTTGEAYEKLNAYMLNYIAPYIICGIYSVVVILSGLFVMFMTSKRIEFDD